MRPIAKSSLAATLSFILLLGCGWYFTELNHALHTKETNNLMQEIVSSQATALERRLNHSLSAAYMLELEVIRSQGDFQYFEQYAAQVMRSISGISNLQLAPSGIIERIYPLSGNEAAIGHNILADDRRRAEARLAIEEKKLTLAGPFELVQGGVAVIGRNPVFLDRGGKQEFWGFVSVLIYLDELIHATELNNYSQRGFKFQLSRRHPDSGKLDLFAGQKDISDAVADTIMVKVPNGEWFLTMSRSESYSHLLGYSVTLGVSLVMALLIFYLVRQPEVLRRTVERQTCELKTLAFHDHLTGLANRRLLIAQLEQEIRDLQRNRTRAALLYVDLDDFKRINDTMGHDAGDVLLKKTAARFRDTLRRNDIISRLGGDEFAILLVDVDAFDNVRKVADHLVETMRKPMSINCHEIVVSASIGITLIPDDGDEVSALMRNADLALYAAKQEGKNCCQFFDHQMQREAAQNLAMERDLRQAIKLEEFVLYFQPLVSLHQRRIVGYEALIRWQHPQHGLIYPDQFIPAAETTHLVIPMGYWVIRKVCAIIAHRQQTGQEAVRIAVNLAPQQFTDPELAPTVLAILSNSGAAADCLELEITESALMENLDVALQTLEQLREAGIGIAIDDFGTGYSSLSQLKTLPVDMLKIDRGFVDGVGDAGHDRQIVEAIIAMAKKLQLKIVAEGIETPEQLAFLIHNQSDYGQGYLFDRPMPEADMNTQALDLSETWPLATEPMPQA